MCGEKKIDKDNVKCNQEETQKCDQKESLQCDQQYMRIALDYARQAAREGEVPIGAVVVDPCGSIIGVGYNRVEQSITQTAHAEMIALAQAAQAYGDWRLENCLLYVTLEPCSMCSGAVRLSRLKGIVYGATSHLFGSHLDKDCFIPLYSNNAPFLKGGVCEKESVEILREFFQNKRKQK